MNTHLPLQGRVALVTGGSRGICAAFLAGPDAGYNTDATLNVDGGQSA